MRFNFRLFIVVILLCTHSVQATETNSTIIYITYGSASWNTDSSKVDSAYLLMRDKNTSKIVQIQLEETEPDSSQFRGQFSVALGSQIAPEVFVPPKEIRFLDRDNRKFYEMVQKNKLERKPAIQKKNEKGHVLFDVYDTREQAAAALKAYQEQLKLAKEQEERKLLEPVPGKASMEAAQQAERQAYLDKLAMEAAKNEQERIRLEQIERQRALERERLAKQASQQERARRQAQSQELENEALAFYNQGEFESAATKFKESVELDPENNSVYYKYGISLYRLNKFNEALVILKLAQVDEANELEKKYYMGLIHYRLGEIDPALRLFGEVARSKDKVMAPSASFYQGVVYFAQEKYEEAKKSFEVVLDTSSDPRLDEQAEEYIDKIAQAMIFKKLRENKWTASGTLGLLYDSNVLLAPDNVSTQGSATDIADFRLLTVADLEYRPVLNAHHEWRAKANVTMINSAQTKAAPADPWLYSLNLPYTYKGTLWKKGYKLSAQPGYEILYMDPTEAGKKTQILASPFLSLDNMFVMRRNWFSNYILELRLDDSNLPASLNATGPDNSDATKVTLKTNQTFLMDKAGKEAMVATLGLVQNAAKGDNKKYQRYDAGVIYVRPTKWGAAWNIGLSIFKLHFPDAQDERKDFNTTLTTGITKPVRDWVTWGIMGSYSSNASNIEANHYSKYTIMTTATFTSVF